MQRTYSFSSNHPSAHMATNSHQLSQTALSPQTASQNDDTVSIAPSTASGPGRSNTLKKRNSVKAGGSSVLHRSSSRRSTTAGSVKSIARPSSLYGIGNDSVDEIHDVFYCPVPTSAHPTDVLANRFQTWRKFLKELVSFFREVQNHYETRAKSTSKLVHATGNFQTPPDFLPSGGISEAVHLITAHHRQALVDATKAREIEEEVIVALTSLRSDLQQKIKEIKSLSGDFKNSVDKEMEATRKAVKALQENLAQSDVDPSLTQGKQDPYLLRLYVDRQVERQIDEENYLHQAFLNLESSGRELESIVVGEVQKAYDAYVNILRSEAQQAVATVEALQGGPVSMAKDGEWDHFIQSGDQLIGPTLPLRSTQQIQYPGQYHAACQEIRSGVLERKSKYLKSYTGGWYVLSPTHLHEFKSSDKLTAPVMSLYLPDQKLGSHSIEGATSHKFALKGRQTGTMHRGHTWVFRAESHDMMMAWYEDIKALIDKTPAERLSYVRGHVRSMSRASRRTTSSDGGVDDVDDDEEAPFSASELLMMQQQQLLRQQQQSQQFQQQNPQNQQPFLGQDQQQQQQVNQNGDVYPGYGQDINAQQGTRPRPGGRFPSDLSNQQNQNHLHRGHDTNSTNSSNNDLQTQTAAVFVNGQQPLGQQANYQDAMLQQQLHQRAVQRAAAQLEAIGLDSNSLRQQQQQQPEQYESGNRNSTFNSANNGTASPSQTDGYLAAGFREQQLQKQQQQQQQQQANQWNGNGLTANHYGNTNRTPIGEAHSYGVIASQEALKNGINPYTGEQFSPSAEPTLPSVASNQTTNGQGQQHDGQGQHNGVPDSTASSPRQQSHIQDWAALRDAAAARNGYGNGGNGTATAIISGYESIPIGIEENTHQVQSQTATPMTYFTEDGVEVDRSIPRTASMKRSAGSGEPSTSSVAKNKDRTSEDHLHMPGEYPLVASA